MPHGLEFNFDFIYEKLARLAPIMGEKAEGVSEEDAARSVIAAIRKLTGRLNELGAQPLRLRDVGVPEDGLDLIAEGALMDGSSFYNPRPMEDEAELMPFVKNAY